VSIIAKIAEGQALKKRMRKKGCDCKRGCPYVTSVIGGKKYKGTVESLLARCNDPDFIITCEERFKINQRRINTDNKRRR